MSKKARRLVFYALLLLFPLLGGAIVLYAEGWRLDWETARILKVGAIYIKSFPQHAGIRLNGKPLQNKSGILARGTFIGGLIPKNYPLTLIADGYLDWNEHIAVKPSFVSEIKYGVLVPNVPSAVATSSAKNFWIIGGKSLIQNERGELLWEDKNLSGDRVIGWTNDFKMALTEDEKTKTYFVNDIAADAPKTANLNATLENLGIRSPGFQKVLIDPAGGNNVLFQTFNSIFALDGSSGKITAIEKTTSTVEAFAASPSWLAWTTFNPKSGDSLLTLLNRLSGNRLDNETSRGKVAKLDFRNDDELGILQSDGGFYIERIGNDPAEKIASDVKDFSFFKNGDSVALLEHNSIEIFSFGSESEYWRFRLPDNENIQRLEWYRDGAHLFVIYPQETRFLDLNDKALENFPMVVSAKNVAYDFESNLFYFMKDSRIWKLQFPK